MRLGLLLPLLPVAVVSFACTAAPPLQSSCLDAPERPGTPVAKVGDKVLTSGDLRERLRAQGSARRQYEDLGRLRQFVEDQIRFELLFQAARERGLSHDPDVVEAARKVMVRKLLQQDLGEKVFAGKADAQLVQKYYQSHIDEYQQPARLRLAQIQLAPTPEGFALAQNLTEKLKADHDEPEKLFRLLAAQYSEDGSSKNRGGELQSFVTQEELASAFGPSFAETAFAMEPATFSTAPVQSKRGWHVVEVIAHRDALARSLEEVRGEIEDRLLESERTQAFDHYLHDIRQRYPVALYEEALTKLAAELAAKDR